MASQLACTYSADHFSDSTKKVLPQNFRKGLFYVIRSACAKEDSRDFIFELKQ